MSLGEALRNQQAFDVILLDSRTGYNLQSILLIQCLATDVVIVGTMAMQSIDGVARMMPLFGQVEAGRSSYGLSPSYFEKHSAITVWR